MHITGWAFSQHTGSSHTTYCLQTSLSNPKWQWIDWVVNGFDLFSELVQTSRLHWSECNCRTEHISHKEDKCPLTIHPCHTVVPEGLSDARTRICWTQHPHSKIWWFEQYYTYHLHFYQPIELGCSPLFQKIPDAVRKYLSLIHSKKRVKRTDAPGIKRFLTESVCSLRADKLQSLSSFSDPLATHSAHKNINMRERISLYFPTCLATVHSSTKVLWSQWVCLVGVLFEGESTRPQHYRPTMEEKVSGEISSVEVDTLDEGTLDEPVLVTIVRFFFIWITDWDWACLRMFTEKGCKGDDDQVLLRTCSQKKQGSFTRLWAFLHYQDLFSCLNLPLCFVPRFQGTSGGHCSCA